MARCPHLWKIFFDKTPKKEGTQLQYNMGKVRLWHQTPNNKILKYIKRTESFSSSSKAGYYFETQLCLQKVWLRGWESPLGVFLSHILTIFRSLKQLLISCVWGRARTRAQESPLFSSSSSPSPSFPLSTSIFCSSGGFSTRFLLKYKNRLFPHYGSKSMLSTPYDYIKKEKCVT